MLYLGGKLFEFVKCFVSVGVFVEVVNVLIDLVGVGLVCFGGYCIKVFFFD